jgi:glutamine---fructose-6-phosphate transaminase (isomerizing)
MCGILGFVISKDARIQAHQIKPLLDRLFLLSESRGKEASGLAVVGERSVAVLKRAVRPRLLVRSEEYRRLLDDFVSSVRTDRTSALAVMGHARMVTNGSSEIHENNQPVMKHGMIVFHNGIVVNDEAIWPCLEGIEREFEVDTEAILSLVAHYRKQNRTLGDAVRLASGHLEGANSFALFADDADALVLATTNGSLYCTSCDGGRIFLYASERYILEQILRHRLLRKAAGDGGAVEQLRPQTACILSLDTMSPAIFPLREPLQQGLDIGSARREIRDVRPAVDVITRKRAQPLSSYQNSLADEKLLSIDESAIASLRRCSRCLLPETFPFIRFDEEGLCSVCRNYTPAHPKGRDDLEELAKPHRRAGSGPDCIMAVSGGRDSTYGLHYVKKVLGMNPVAYTYDWGMVTDLARRNISRVCGSLGVEHILISADIRRKRENVRQNVSAWLKRPDLGTVPLFMAGDKPFFYYAGLLKRQIGLGLVFFCMNPLERTDFKSAFCGIEENHGKTIHWDLSLLHKLQLGLYYGRQFLGNPAYLNRSLIDTAFAFASYYLMPKDFSLLFQFIGWDERAIEETLANEYGWERARDTRTTWRIGDGTAAFYNYIYCRVAGFTENDTFRSNQIREGLLTRDEAMALTREENRPRLEAIEWYCRTIGIDWREAIRRINAIPTMYDSAEPSQRTALPAGILPQERRIPVGQSSARGGA